MLASVFLVLVSIVLGAELSPYMAGLLVSYETDITKHYAEKWNK